jgi:disease resistance protein RPM1
MLNVTASMHFGSETTVCKAARLTPTLMPSAQKLWFRVHVQEFIKDGNHDIDRVSLALEYFASLQNVVVNIHNDGASSAAEVEQVEAALRRAADAHPNRPTLELHRWNSSALLDQHFDFSE